MEPGLPGSERKLTVHPEQVKVQERYQYYDIDGVSADDLRAQMKRNGTTWNDGNVYAALTTWDIRYHYDITSKDGRYELCDISTDVDIVFHMPRLSPGAKAPLPLKTTWEGYYQHLQTHESGHRDIAVRIGEDLYRELAALGSSASRKDLDREAQTLIKTEFRKLKAEQIEYDAETHHGIKQGAVLSEPTLASSAEQ
ncbi:DUF922 domain-containing protein [Geomonas limicola]|uniref:DUF922 domain-containing protein n=1 Tax=Geomonas limicola TaxID=2740186 RepID=UPI001612936F|nr:DUF922 domain-containing protein [Geomonas limicola]